MIELCCRFTTNLTSDLNARCDIANNNNGDVFISIHYNGGSPTNNGTETFYADTHDLSTSMGLATKIQNELIATLGTNDRGAKPNPDYRVVKYSYMPAVLVEVAYVTNSSNYYKVNSPSEQQEAAYSIYSGLVDWAFGW